VSAGSGGPRSSNLRISKKFADRDRDNFLDQGFEFMVRFFENSLHELEARNPGIQGRFKRLDASRFSASIYENGKTIARCQVRLGGLAGGISFSYSDNPDDNSFNESLSVEAGEQELHFRPLGMPMHRGVAEHLGLEGAAEYYWDLLIERLQR
jgi:hypothetical protein